MKKRIIPIFVPHRGCPHDCIFCNQKKITGVSTDITSEDVKNIVDEYLTTIDKDANVEIAFFGGSFTAIDVDIQKSLLSVAKEYVDKGLVNDIRMSTRPDCIDEDILKMLKEYKLEELNKAIKEIHFPQEFKEFDKARNRLVFEELFAVQLALLELKNKYITEEYLKIHESGYLILKNCFGRC